MLSTPPDSALIAAARATRAANMSSGVTTSFCLRHMDSLKQQARQMRLVMPARVPAKVRVYSTIGGPVVVVVVVVDVVLVDVVLVVVVREVLVVDVRVVEVAVNVHVVVVRDVVVSVVLVVVDAVTVDVVAVHVIVVVVVVDEDVLSVVVDVVVEVGVVVVVDVMVVDVVVPVKVAVVVLVLDEVTVVVVAVAVVEEVVVDDNVLVVVEEGNSIAPSCVASHPVGRTIVMGIGTTPLELETLAGCNADDSAADRGRAPNGGGSSGSLPAPPGPDNDPLLLGGSGGHWRGGAMAKCSILAFTTSSGVNNRLVSLSRVVNAAKTCPALSGSSGDMLAFINSPRSNWPFLSKSMRMRRIAVCSWLNKWPPAMPTCKDTPTKMRLRKKSSHKTRQFRRHRLPPWPHERSKYCSRTCLAKSVNSKGSSSTGA